MKILIISPVYPFPMRDGFEVRIGDLCRFLSDRAEVHFIAVGNHGLERQGENSLFASVTRVASPAWPRWRRLYRRFTRARFTSWIYRTPQLEATIARLQTQEQFDVVLVQTPLLAASVARIPGLPLKIVDTVDLWWERYRSFLELGCGNLLAHLRDAQAEVDVYRKFDVVATSSQYDYDRLAQAGVDPEQLVHAPVAFEPHPIVPAETPADLLFAGASGETNVDAVRFFVRDVLPAIQKAVPSTRLLLMRPDPGLRAEYEQREDVVFLPFIPDLRDVYQRCRLAIVPLRRGSGIKIKVLEALSFGIPTIVTPCAAQGIRLDDFAQQDITADPERLADEIVRALCDEDYRAALRVTGLSIIERYYRREHAYSDLVDRMDASRRSGSSLTDTPERRTQVTRRIAPEAKPAPKATSTSI